MTYDQLDIKGNYTSDFVFWRTFAIFLKKRKKSQGTQSWELLGKFPKKMMTRKTVLKSSRLWEDLGRFLAFFSLEIAIFS
jgi:hypothetical protein